MTGQPVNFLSPPPPRVTMSVIMPERTLSLQLATALLRHPFSRLQDILLLFWVSEPTSLSATSALPFNESLH